jgi:hypothetical protein
MLHYRTSPGTPVATLTCCIYEIFNMLGFVQSAANDLAQKHSLSGSTSLYIVEGEEVSGR